MEVDQIRAMDTHKLLRIEYALIVAHDFLLQIETITGVDFDIIIIGN